MHIYSFAISTSFIAFIELPLRMHVLEMMGAKLRNKTMFDAMKFHKDQNTQVILCFQLFVFDSTWSDKLKTRTYFKKYSTLLLNFGSFTSSTKTRVLYWTRNIFLKHSLLLIILICMKSKDIFWWTCCVIVMWERCSMNFGKCYVYVTKGFRN